MAHPNALLFLIDALRYDLLANADLRKILAPNIDRLIRRGTLHRIVAQAPNTQFVLPAFFSSSRPLDYGGYNDGICRRPASFVECLKDTGYETAMFSTCVQYNRDLGFDRGFDLVRNAVNSRRALKQDLSYRLGEPLRRWREGRLSEEQITELIRNDLGRILTNLSRVCARGSRAPCGFARVRRIDRGLAKGAGKEQALLASNPNAILQKFVDLPAEYFYWTALGKKSLGVKFLALRVMNKLYKAFLGRLHMKFLRVDNVDEFNGLCEEILPEIETFLACARSPWFAHIHVMDVHTHDLALNQILRCPRILLRRLGRAKRAGGAWRTAKGRPPLLHDLAIMAVDHMIGRVIKILEQNGLLKNTCIFITADHGKSLPGLDQRPTPDFTERFHRQSLEVPFVIVGAAPSQVSSGGLFDSRDVSVTLLDCLGVESHEAFQGISLLRHSGRTAVVSEHAGRGFCDLVSHDLFFVITGMRYKLFVTLRGSEISPTHLYDRQADPMELENLVGRPEHAGTIRALAEWLWQDRREIFEARGWQPRPDHEDHRLAARAT